MTCAALAAEAAKPAALPATLEPAILAEDVRPHVEFLADEKLQGRSGREARLAADYIRDEFHRLHLKPLFADGEFFQPIPGSADENGNQSVIGRNVGAWLPGGDPQLRDEFIIVSAHYDHLGVRDGQVFAGADDNATGVAMMLEVAERLTAGGKKSARSIAFVGFDLEERMLWGSRWFAAHPPRPLEQVKLFITADMIGRSLGNLPLPTVFVLGSEHAPRLKQTLDGVGVPDGLEVARLGIDLVGTRSDYGPFRDRKVPFLFFSTGEHPDYHTPRDVPDRIDYDKAARISSLVLELVKQVANDREAPQWTDDLQPDLDEARAVNRITGLVLEQDKRDLTDLQRTLVSHVNTKTEQILERGEMTADERTWLTRMSQLLLLSVF
jgi:hypothetical protein